VSDAHLASVDVVRVNDPPQVGVPELAQYTEDASLTVLAPYGSVIDSDTPIFANGSLTVDIVSNGTADDLISIKNEGTAAGQVSVTGTDVFYGGLLVATSGGGSALDPLRILFNSSASRDAVQAVVRSMTFVVNGNDPSPATRTVEWTLLDGEGGVSATVRQAVQVHPVNDAPRLDASLTGVLAPINEDDVNSVGTPLGSIVGQSISDPDSSDPKGIAVVRTGSGGTWQFSINGGAWQDLTGVADASARLLPVETTYVRFLPNANVNGISTFDFLAWDQTQGAVGGTFDTTANRGGTFSFSMETATASVSVTPVNDAPILDSTRTPSLGTIVEDATNPGGVLVSNLVIGVSDVDAGALKGVAVTAAQAGGAWQYALDGITWVDFPAVSESSALLLPASTTARVRLIPVANFNGTRTLTFRAWDQTQGTAGGTINAALNQGGIKSLSTTTYTAILTVMAVNDVPVAQASSVTTSEDTVRSFATADFLFTDVESNPLASITINSLTLAAGDTLKLSGTNVLANQTIPASSIPNLVYKPAANANGASRSTFRFTVNDTGLGTATAAMTINVTAVNDAPVLNTALSPKLNTIYEDATNPGGTLISTLLAGAVTDPDAGALSGIAVTSAGSVSGTWQFTLNGGTGWLPVGTPSESAALLLPSNPSTRVRFLPNPNVNGTVGLVYRAWDQTQGVAGGTLSTANRLGGSNTFSVVSQNATQTIIAVNDSPVINSSMFPTLNMIFEDATAPGGTPVSNIVGGITDADAGAAKGIAVISAGSGNGKWQFTLDAGTTWQSMGAVSESAARLLPATMSTKVRFIPNADFNGAVNLYYRAWDQTIGTAGSQMSTSGQLGRKGAFSTGFTHATQAITPVDDAPSLQSISGSIGYAHDSPTAILLASTATVSDIDSPDFDTGKLIVHITTTGTTGTNVLGIGGGFAVDTSNNNVWLGAINTGKLIGVRTSSGVGTDLIVTFNASMTPAIAQQLVRAINFKTAGGAQANTTRSIQFSISDGDGKTSVVLTKAVNLN
jgi:hypothetical protein